MFLLFSGHRSIAPSRSHSFRRRCGIPLVWPAGNPIRKSVGRAALSFPGFIGAKHAATPSLDLVQFLV